MSILRRLVAALVVLPILAGISWAQDYRVRTGDVLQIEVLEDGNLNRSAIEDLKEGRPVGPPPAQQSE